jgi:hypothetical protein
VGECPSWKWEIVALSVCATALFMSASLNSSNKKSSGERSAQERYSANMLPPENSENRLKIAIEEYSTKEEMENLASAYAGGGDKALKKAIQNVKKGYFNYGGSNTEPLYIVETASKGSTRSLFLVGLAPLFFARYNAATSAEDRPFPYSYIELDVDEHGKGHGTMFPRANLALDEKGNLKIKPMSRIATRLEDVHWDK